MCADEAVVQLPGSTLSLSHPMAGLHGCCYALPGYLGLFHILICKVQTIIHVFSCFADTQMVGFIH
jgi:hypothetical protein